MFLGETESNFCLLCLGEVGRFSGGRRGQRGGGVYTELISFDIIIVFK